MIELENDSTPMEILYGSTVHRESEEGPYRVVKKMNDVVYSIRKLPNGKLKVIHFNRLAPYKGDNNNRQELRAMKAKENQVSFEEFMGAYEGTGKARFCIVAERHRDLFAMPKEYSLAYCVSTNLGFSKGIDRVFNYKYGGR